MPRCIPGVTFLHSHQQMEKMNNIPDDHIIVDKKDWDIVLKFLTALPQDTLDAAFGNASKDYIGG